MIRTSNTVIIGAGLSGLFAAENLYNSKDHDFLLVYGAKEGVGGFATRGGMKVGMPPAGRKTIEWVGEENYNHLLELFLSRYGHLLQSLTAPISSPRPLPPSLYQKLYYSFYLPKSSGKQIALTIRSKIKDRIQGSFMTSVIREGDGYLIKLENRTYIRTKNIIVASGRNFNVFEAFKAVGQGYHESQDILYGCRATFDPVTAGIINNQLDLKIRDDKNCTTYCFNYRGNIQQYQYADYNIYSGTLDPNSNVGNAFFGKRVVLPCSGIDFFCLMEYKENLKLLTHSPLWERQEVRDVYEFIEKVQEYLSLSFQKVYFPALEQFWPRPFLTRGNFESEHLKRIFFIGDASGVSFGILQSFISANIATCTIGSYL